MSQHSPEIQCGVCDRLYQREECGKDSQAAIVREASNGIAFLGEGLQREYLLLDWTRERSGDIYVSRSPWKRGRES